MQVNLLKQLVPTFLVIALQKYNIEKAGLLNHVRAAFLMAQLFCLSVALVIRYKIKNAKDTGAKVEVPAVKQFGHEVKPAMTQQLKEYDMSKWKEMVQQIFMGGLICFGIHYQWKYVIPLVMQIVMTPMSTLDNPLSMVYLWGRPAQGNLKRPWPPPNPFGFPGVQEHAKDTKESKAAALEAKKEKARNRKKGD
mmetsp:Transcript_145316/g.253606  ORF Transcript_145316/g.253606 Transcript_145316/m.253606 type:complete len:194 (-) Transcript_145316:75-656(-)